MTTLNPTHKHDIYDVEIKRIHIEFRELGIKHLPLELITLPRNAEKAIKFRDKLRNTWYMRNRDQDNLEILQNALLKAKKDN